MSSGGATLALAAMGQTIVILTGGFDLSAGAVISLVNVVLGTWHAGRTPASQILFGARGARHRRAGRARSTASSSPSLRLQPIVVTLSTMFIVQGVTLLIMDKPGGMIAPEFSAFLVGDAIPGLLPMPVLVLGVALLALGFWLKSTRFGIGLYAVGSDADAARAAGIPTRAGRSFGAYVMAGVLLWRSPACSSAPRPARPTRWSATRCCCRCSRPSWSAARCSAAGAAVPSAPSSAPIS